MNPDVVVIGGGIVGCSCAYYLARAGVRVTLVEKSGLVSGASRAGMTHIVTWEEPEIHLKLSMASKHLYEELSQDLPTNIEFRQTGSIAIVEKPEKMAAFGETVHHLQQWGLKCRMVDGKELVEMEPSINPDVAGGAYFDEDAQVNPMYASMGLAMAAEAKGAVVQICSEVTGIELSKDKNSVEAVVTTQGRIPTKAVVIAAGAWSGNIGKMVGLDIPISPRKGTLIITMPVPADLVNCKIILAAGYMDSVKSGGTGMAVAANLQQTSHGNLLLGSSRQFVGFNRAVDPMVVTSMLSRCLRFFPVIKNITAIRMWAGFRPYTPDLLPIIGPVGSIEGVFIASGHEGIGITEGPITGKLISQLVTGQIPELPLDEISLSRFKN